MIRIRRAVTAAGMVLLTACSSTTTTTSTNAPQAEAPSAPEPASPERRAQVRMELAAAYFARGQNQTALEELKLALAAKPDFQEAYNLRGLIYGALGEPKLADESFQRALQLNPRDGGTMHNYGWLLCQQSRFEDADAQFKAALALPQYRDQSRTLLAQGVCLARAGRWQEAERVITRAYEIEPTNPTIAFNLSDVLYRRAEYERARFYIRRVNAAREQSNAQSLWLAARIERRMGNLAGVQDLGRQMRERFPQSPETLQLEQGRFDE
jgi:type IV pilus assembly protein PilF